ncbi:MAG: hypothetical protein V5A25_05065 [Halovenus sp.]
MTVREFEQSLAHMDTLASVRDLITDAASEAGVDATLFEEATIHHSAGVSIATALEVFTDATELRMVNPSFSLIFMGLSSDSPMLSDGEVTALVQRDMLTELTALSPGTAETYLRTETDPYEFDGDLPFSFALVDRPAGRSLCLILGDDRNGMAVVETDTDAAIEWGTELYERVLEDARPVPPGELLADLD